MIPIARKKTEGYTYYANVLRRVVWEVSLALSSLIPPCPNLTCSRPHARELEPPWGDPKLLYLMSRLSKSFRTFIHPCSIPCNFSSPSRVRLGSWNPARRLSRSAMMCSDFISLQMLLKSPGASLYALYAMLETTRRLPEYPKLVSS